MSGLRADATRLPFRDGSFRAAIALGVLPWVDDPARLLKELRRVCADDGHVIVSSDSRRRLHWAIDPLYSPTLRPARRALRAVAERPSRRRSTPPSAALHETWEVEDMLRGAGALPVRRAAVGFGPFTFLGMPLLRPATGSRISTALEQAAERNARLEPRSNQHLVLARKGVAP